MKLNKSMLTNINRMELSRKILSPTIKLLGDLLGEVIIEQAGNEVLIKEETIRLLAKKFREEEDLDAFSDLQSEIKQLPEDERLTIIKAFSIFFQLANLAEEDYRIHLNKEFISQMDSQDTLKYAIDFALSQNINYEELMSILEELSLKLVWTAHPTEARRLTNLMKLRQVYALIEKLEEYPDHDLEYKIIRNKIKEHITLLWQTDDLREEKVKILDEVRTNLFYFDNTIFSVLPHALNTLKETIREKYQITEAHKLPNFIEFGSWVGGDRDGHPGVTSSVTIQILLLQKRTCLRKYLSSIRQLIQNLSSSLNNIDISDELRSSIEKDEQIFSEFADKTQQLNKLEPYRRKLDFIRIKLENTLEYVEHTAVEVGLGRTMVGFHATPSKSDFDKNQYYHRSKDFLHELTVIENSLILNRGEIIASGDLSLLINQVNIFGFHLAPLDIRQHSKVHIDAIIEIFNLIGMDNFDVLTREEKIRVLEKEINNPRPLGIISLLENCNQSTRELFDTLNIIRESLNRISPRAIESYIISMTRDEIDILILILLLKEVGIIRIHEGQVNHAGLDVVPLFETKEDLENAAQVMDRLFRNKLYKSLLNKRDNIQEIMIGYSDSTKDVGYLQSNYRLLVAQQELVQVATKYNIKLRIFHGRGGSTSRGGGPTNKAILSQLPGTLTRMKITEQGEVIGSNYSNPEIAYRHLEQIISALIIRSIQDKKLSVEQNPASPPKQYLKNLRILADDACDIYESMVKRDPKFIPFYLEYTPLDIIERATIGSRPSRRTSSDVKNVDALRAIPWVFSWMQTRLVFPAYYGVGSSIEHFLSIDQSNTKLQVLQEMYNDWPYFQSLINNLQMVCLKADMNIAKKYLDLINNNNKQSGIELFERIKKEYKTTKSFILQITNTDNLLETSPDIRNSIVRRNPYIDPLNLIQLELLKKWRELGRPEDLRPEGIQRALLYTINGIAAGLRNTG